MNPAAVKKADAKFHAAHPELGGRQLTMAPGDRGLRAEWMQMYKAEDAAEKAGFGPCPVGNPVLPCGPVAVAPAPTPTPAPPPKPVCSIEVRANQLNSTLDYYHLFIVFTNGAGEQFYLRGGPSAGGGRVASEMSGGSSNASSACSSGSGSNPSASSDSSDDTAGGPFGAIATQYGKYEPGTIDWDPAAKSVTIKKDEDACALDSALIAQMDAIAASGTRYNPLGPNSNTTVFQALKNLGLAPVTPAGVWAPGKDQEIKVAAPAVAP
jgi:hypothetical protein